MLLLTWQQLPVLQMAAVALQAAAARKACQGQLLASRVLQARKAWCGAR
jgi:hypothetical protein